MPLAAGDKLGHYEILAPLGKGGMGAVYRARDTQLDREVAIKVLPPSLAGDPDRLARFDREAKILAAHRRHLWTCRIASDISKCPARYRDGTGRRRDSCRSHPARPHVRQGHV